MKTKICSKCNKEKILKEFPVRLERKIGVRSECKVCHNKKRSENRLLNKTYCEIIYINYKQCGKCKEIKNKSLFGKDSIKKDGLKSYCKSCRNYEYDKEKRRKFINKWTNDYNKKNPHKVAWRNILKHSLERLGKSKEGKTIDLLGYSALDLKTHIESLFTEGMSWDNYGEWHIDHKIGLINFDKNTSVHIVNALSNLQPLWATTREINGVIYEGNLNKMKYI